MTAEEAFEWRDLKILAFKVYRQFHVLPGSYLEAEDFHSVGVAAVALKLEKHPDTDLPLLKTIAYRRMFDYGRKCADVRRRNHLADGCRGLRAVANLEDIERTFQAGDSPVRDAVGAEVRSWLETPRFGLSEKEVDALRLYYWLGATNSEIVALLNKEPRHPSLAQYWIRHAEAKIRRGLQVAEIESLQDQAQYHRQLRARSAECTV